jgi:hypothetical protein
MSNKEGFFVALFLVVGLAFFATGLRFINPLDTAFRLLIGGAIAVGSVAYLKQHRHI